MPFSTYQQGRIGSVTISPTRGLVAGTHEEITITYTAGDFGIDDTGAIKISWRSASDSSRPQFSDAKAPNYTTAIASNGAVLQLEANRNNIRPWVGTVLVRVANGFLRKGDTITVRLGDRRGGSSGYRVQSAVETDFPFKVFVDAFATYDFVEVPNVPGLELVAGRPERFKAILPTLRRVGEPFRLAVLAEDRWANVVDSLERAITLKPSRPVAGLPPAIAFKPGDGPRTIEGLRLAEPGDLHIDLLDAASGEILGRSNPLRVAAGADLLHYWGDLHGQSGETVGIGTAAQYFAFAKHRAFLDIVGHQGNDFQITDEFWAEINRLAAAYDKPGEMVAFPGYEWSGNTGMGGDRNVFFAAEGRTIRRSSSVLLDVPAATDCHHVRDLFEALQGEDAVIIAHVGGRYADLRVGHDGRLERAVEIHSCWGTFEWLLHDAFALGHRVAIVCHSDDHKGRPGAAYPGTSQFGAVGGLTCYLMPKLDRPNVFAALRKRHTYGTTGTRLFLDVNARLPEGSIVFSDDPSLGTTTEHAANSAMMGDVVRAGSNAVEITVEALGAAPIERLTVFNGTEAIGEIRGYGPSDLGRRIRVLFEGAEYRGRSRETFWRGSLRLVGNRFTRVKPINHFNADKLPRLAADGSALDFDTVTTGNFSGFDLWLEDKDAGTVDIVSNVVCRRLAVRDVGFEEMRVDLGGLGRCLRVYRLPDRNDTWRITHTQTCKMRPGVDNPLYVRLTQEDGHQAWSSPIYVIS
jgi:hypothetical protein